jgi:hypothetical protein
MVKPDGKVTVKYDVKEHRKTLFRCLDGVLSLAHRKIHTPRGSSDRAKQGWARVLVSAVNTYGALLKGEELELRVLALEEQLKDSILIPKGDRKK